MGIRDKEWWQKMTKNGFLRASKWKPWTAIGSPMSWSREDYLSEQIHEARLSFEEGNFDHCEEYIDQILKADPQNPWGRHFRAKIFLHNQHIEKATQTWSEVLQVSPRFAPAWMELAEIHRENSEYHKALMCYVEAILLSSHGDDYNQQYHIEDSPPETMATLPSPLFQLLYDGLERELTTPWLGQFFECMYRMGLCDDILGLSKALEPKSFLIFDHYMWIALSYFQSKKSEEGLQYIKSHLEHSPTAFQIVVRLFPELMQENLLHECGQLLDIAEDVLGQKSEITFRRGYLYLKLQDWEKLDDLLAEALKQYPDQQELHMVHFHKSYLLQDYRTALQAIESFIARRRDHVPSQYWKAMTLRQLHMEDELKSCLDYLASLCSGSVGKSLWLAKYYFYRRQFQRCLDVLLPFQEDKTIAIPQELILLMLQSLVELDQYQEAQAFLTANRIANDSWEYKLLHLRIAAVLHPLTDYSQEFVTLWEDHPEQLECFWTTIRYLFGIQAYDLAWDTLARWPKVHESTSALRWMMRIALADERFKDLSELLRDNSVRHAQLSDIGSVYLEYSLGRKDMKSAQTILTRFSESVMSSTQGKIQYLRFLLHSGQIRTGYDESRRFLSEPNDHDYLNYHLNFCIQLGQYEEALELIEDKEVSGIHLQSSFNLTKINALFLLYRYDDVIKLLNRVQVNGPRAVHIYLRACLLHIVMGSLDEAYAQLLQATDDVVNQPRQSSVIVPLRSHPAMVLNEIEIHQNGLGEMLSAYKRSNEKTLRVVLSHGQSTFGKSLYWLLYQRRQNPSAQIIRWGKESSSDPIPHKIMQYWDSSRCPDAVRAITHSWSQINPDFEYSLYSYSQARAYIDRNGTKEQLMAFEACKNATEQADYFRLVFIYHEGGIYADADDKALEPLDDLLSVADLVVFQEDFGSIANNFFVAIPRHPVIEQMLDHVTSSLLSYGNENPWFKTGPGIWTQFIGRYILENAQQDSDLPSVAICSNSYIRLYLCPHLPLWYKETDDNWYISNYKRKLNKKYR